MGLPFSMMDWDCWPPRARLPNINPKVRTNHAARTGQRWRALQTATLTVQGSRFRTVGPAVNSLSTLLLLRALSQALPGSRPPTVRGIGRGYAVAAVAWTPMPPH